MTDVNQIAAAMGVNCIISGEMQEKMLFWDELYTNKAHWQKGRTKPLRIPSAVSKELKRLTLKEFSANVNDVFTDEAFQKFIPILRRKLDYGLALGGMLFKPYWNGSPHIDIVFQNEYVPVNFSDDFCESVICPENLTIGKTSYTRLEMHTYNVRNQTHTIENRCFRSNNPAVLGSECSLSEVPEWSDILPKKIFYSVSQPLFSVFRVPDMNTIDTDSPLGISVFADAVDTIKNADDQWERILWELESSERAIDAAIDFFKLKDGKPVLPVGRERMFHTYETNPNTDKPIFSTFSPEIRDSSYFNAFNQMLRRIENSCGLAYGCLSEIGDVEKTAEEIKSSKQRSYDRVHEIQETLRPALETAVYGMKYLSDYYSGKPNTDVKLTCTFGDGILEDADKEFNRRMQMVTSGLLSKEKFLMWYFSCDESKAREFMPVESDLFGGNNAVPV